ncbi:hypothetical protein A9Q81_23500 [Gammaproteobacteria bacterium 42_54_T18]|nr:hypothetical protein A9Q81_23500 [Gammaproteobacteria bacterium 42_54_T18]
MIISEMREKSVSLIQNIKFTQSSGRSRRRSLWLFLTGTLILSSQGVQLAYQRLLQRFRKQQPQATSDSPPFINIANIDDDLVDEGSQAAPNIFERLIMRGTLSEGPLIREEYGTTNEMGERNSLVILTTRLYIHVRRFFKGMSMVVNQEATEYAQQALRLGELRDAVRSREWMRTKETTKNHMKLNIRNFRHSFWGSLGLADKAELAVLRTEISQLKNSLELRAMAPLSTITTHDRRQLDRRKGHLTVAYERRSLERRA